IDIFPIDPLAGAMLLKKNFTPEKRKDFKFVFEPPISVDTMHAVCSKNNKKCEYYLSKFNEGLKLITDNGIKQQIIDKSLSLE
ncbi:MAG: hypothetical protein GY857_16020, partial [Desulfobacula sp.]|nr:hypothetical protein [Desulfobacula sp.]